MSFLGLKLEIFIFFLLKEALLIGRKAAYIRGTTITTGGLNSYSLGFQTFWAEFWTGITDRAGLGLDMTREHTHRYETKINGPHVFFRTPPFFVKWVKVLFCNNLSKNGLHLFDLFLTSFRPFWIFLNFLIYF